MPPIWRVVSTALANILLAASILLFASGFFPHKAVLPGLATWNESHTALTTAPPFDKVIFMVVDALRSDFVYGNASNFHFTQALIRDGAAIPFTGHASPPTITMPKVKAITTGSVPSFVDLILNFAESDTSSTLSMQDSWLAQMRAKSGGRLVMYGDDTWLRLFPDFFTRADGTTSFFVSDFWEVDSNVTRHISDELQNDDWTGMVLHFLGLDHIGHKTGPQGPNMPAKQQEMDAIVRQIYAAMEERQHLESCLLVLLGDHGMNEAGNHGASSAGETSTALTFVSPKFKTAFHGVQSPLNGVSDYKFYDLVQQSDVAPTLAALLGFPIPKNSLGVIIPRLLQLWKSESDRFDLLYANAEQVMRIAQATFPDAFTKSDDPEHCRQYDSLADEEQLACSWRTVSGIQHEKTQRKDLERSIIRVDAFLKEAQSMLSRAASQYDLSKMALGIGMAGIASTLSAASAAAYISPQHNMFSGPAFFVVLVIYAIIMFASSYVEEEHQFWYWTTSAWLVLLASKSARSESISDWKTTMASAAVYVLFGVTRRWKQTGQKYAGDPDLISEVLQVHPWLLWSLILATYAIVSRRLSRKATRWGSKKMTVFPVIVSISAFLFKLAFTAADAPELLQGISIFDPILAFLTRYPLSNLARIVFIGLIHLTEVCIYYEKPWEDYLHKQSCLDAFHDVLSLFLITQTRTINIPLFLVYYTQAWFLQTYQRLEGLELTLTSLLMQFSSFYAMGGTNAISSVDLSNAYNGVGGYNALAVGILTFVSNWAGPIWWTSATFCLLSKKSDNSSNGLPRSSYFAALTLFATVSTLAVMVACMVLREHLFIWTVFSPKYLYTIAWIFGQHFVVNGLFGSLTLGYK